MTYSLARNDAIRHIPSTPLSVLPRLEGAAIAAATVVFFVLSNFDWWWLPALFLIFDLSAIGYTVSLRAGAIGYNLIHNYAAPAVLLMLHGVLVVSGSTIWVCAFVAGCWFFHVGVDRALGYGPRPTG